MSGRDDDRDGRRDDGRFGTDDRSGGDEDRFGWPDEGRGDRESAAGRSRGGRAGGGRTGGDRRGDGRSGSPRSPAGRPTAAGSGRSGGPGATGGVRVAGLAFTTRELLDLAVAWVALGLAFAFFLFGRQVVFAGVFPLVFSLGISMATVGVGFLLHELAHKVVAVRFGQVAHFRADYGMLVLAVIAGLAGFLFAAPGAVYHRGRITPRENGLIAVAGPVTNVALVVPFLPLVVLPDPLGLVGIIGVTINAVLAAFNMLPFGPLDGKTVLSWSKPVFAGVFLLTLAMAAASVGLFFGFL